MKKIISKRMFKNMLIKGKGNAPVPELVKFHNIIVNGVSRGCSGFLRYQMEDGSTSLVYVNTEPSCLASLADYIMFRTAKNDNDYTGGVNHWYKPTFNEFDYRMAEVFWNLVRGF